MTERHPQTRQQHQLAVPFFNLHIKVHLPNVSRRDNPAFAVCCVWRTARQTQPHSVYGNLHTKTLRSKDYESHLTTRTYSISITFQSYSTSLARTQQRPNNANQALGKIPETGRWMRMVTRNGRFTRRPSLTASLFSTRSFCPEGNGLAVEGMVNKNQKQYQVMHRGGWGGGGGGQPNQMPFHGVLYRSRGEQPGKKAFVLG